MKKSVLKWDDCFSVQLPFELLVWIPVQLLLGLELSSKCDCDWTRIFFKIIFFHPKCVTSCLNRQNSKALTKYGWQKMKRNACQKCILFRPKKCSLFCPQKMQSFSEKQTAFSTGISFIFGRSYFVRALFMRNTNLKQFVCVVWTDISSKTEVAKY